mgnify:CR=1 FL=1
MTVKFSGVVKAGNISPDVMPRFAYTAAETMSVGDIVAKGESNDRVVLAKADDSTRMPAIGAVQSLGSGSIVYIVTAGIMRSISRLANFGFDQALYVSTTAGKVTTSPPDGLDNFVQNVGRSITATDGMLGIDETVLQIKQA